MNHHGEGESPATPEEYIATLPGERAEQVSQLRELVLRHLPDGYAEQIDFGMICYVIPLETYPDTYNGHPLMYAAIASQKRHISLYLMNVYGDEESQRRFAEGFAAAGKKLDMGKACVRFKALDDLPLELIAETVARTPAAGYIASYEASRAQMAEESQGAAARNAGRKTERVMHSKGFSTQRAQRITQRTQKSSRNPSSFAPSA